LFFDIEKTILKANCWYFWLLWFY